MGKTAILAGATGPVIWNLLGYQFEAALMIAGLCTCLMVRIWVVFYALLSGTGSLGAGIIAVALAWVKCIEPIAGVDLPGAGSSPSGDAPSQHLLTDARENGHG